MPEDSPNHSESPKDAGADSFDKDEVERVLAEATGLTGNISDEVGAVDPVPGSIGDIENMIGKRPESDVAAELDRVEATLGEIAGKTSLEQTPPGQTDSATPPNPSLPEKTNPDAAAPPPPLDEPPAKREPHELPPPDPDPAKASTEEGQDGAKGNLEPRPSMREAILAHLTAGKHMAKRGAAACIEYTLSGLDAIDGLFTWVNYDVRRILGWVALAFVIGAVTISLANVTGGLTPIGNTG